MTDILPHKKQLFFLTLRNILANHQQQHENTVRELARSIQSNPILEEVIFSFHSGIDDERIGGCLRDAIFQNRNVKELRFSFTRLDLKEICGGIRQMVGLKTLELNYCNEMHNTDVPTFTRLFRSNRNLREFCLRRSSVGDAAAQALARSLRFRISLKEFHLLGCSLSRAGILSVSQALQHHSQLESLCLEDYHMVPDHESTTALAQGIERNSSLVKLTLGFQQIPPNSAKLLLHALAANDMLKDVEICDLELDRDGTAAVARLIADNSTLERLVLEGVLDSDEGIEGDADEFREADIDIASIFGALGNNQSLKKLNLHHWVLRIEDLSSLSGANLYNSMLEQLDLYCHIDANCTSLLCQFIQKCSGLKHLYIAGHVAMDCAMVECLCKGLKQNKSLESLQLNDAQIGDSGAGVLASFISVHGTLKKVSLNDNKISDDGFVSLAGALKHPTLLEKLLLAGNDNVSDRGIRALLDGIKENRSLTNVSLPSENMSRSQEEELALYMARNKGLRPLLSQDLPLGIWPYALKRASEYNYWNGEELLARPDLLYYLVQEKHVELLSNVRRGVRRSRKRKRTELK